MSIRILSPEVASAIAAGEVIERPLSVVKELLENALDAGATRVEVRIQDGGRRMVQVVDDGCGIRQAEVPLAVSRHATSKLVSIEDLFAIKTLGFRGEALASIGAVAHLELVTRASDEQVGTRLRVEGGELGKPQPTGAPSGTQVTVTNLFFNVPARQKFLKSEETERRRITELVTRYGLAYPDVRFRLEMEGREVFQSAGAGDRRGTLSAVFGPTLAREMIWLAPSKDAPVKVTGFISPPSVHRSARRDITFFVNGRWVQDASLAAAVIQAYHGLMMVGRFPLAFAELQLPPAEVDVNVHPAKAEIRFRRPDAVFAVVQRTIRAALVGQAPAPELGFAGTWAGASLPSMRGPVGPDWLIGHSLPAGGTEPAPLPSQTRFMPEGVPLLRAVGQVGATYLVAEGPDGIYLIDQHSAHERVLFETLLSQRQAGQLESQGLLQAVTLDLAPSKAMVLTEQLSALNRLGFEVEAFGSHSFRVRAVPVLLASLDPLQAVQVLVDDFEEDESPLRQEQESRMAARICKRAAVKAGQVLSLAEQEKLIRDLERCQVPRACPHGRPTMIHLSVASLERQFGRRE